MRIVIDLQGAQTESRFRGIGRYSLSLTKAIVQEAGAHEVWIALNAQLPDSVALLQQELASLVPESRLRIYDVPACEAAGSWTRRAAELLRHRFISDLAPDVVLVTSMFESGNAVTSIESSEPRSCTAVVLYDLIPLLHAEQYLTVVADRRRYEEKLESVRRADILLAISESSRSEAIRHLPFAPDRVSNISTAVSSKFSRTEPADKEALLRQLKISRPFIMYAPGGFDARKNFNRLLDAFSRLPSDLRRKHQLVIVGKTHRAEYTLSAAARDYGLEKEELIFTGYVSDTDLIALYSLTELFVFPSLHEGFGLPVLEAMSCGAPVLGSNTSSIPEVIGLPEAMFDPLSPADIADKIAEVLSNPQLQSRLREHGLTRARYFSWNLCARRALEAMERACAAKNHRPQPLAGNSSSFLASLAELPGSEQVSEAELAAVAQSIVYNEGAPVRQLLLDISTIVHADAKSGIQRVVRSLLAELVARPPAGFAVRPIYYDHGVHRYAQGHVARLTGISAADTHEGPVDVHQGDVYLSLDLNMHLVAQTHGIHERMRARGVRQFFIVYDLLLVHHPEWWPPEMAVLYRNWISSIAQTANGLVCISGAVAEELRQYLRQNPPTRRDTGPKVSSFHLGADVENSLPTRGLPPNAPDVLQRIRSSPSFLSVATIEPRKGHAQMLSAFEELWAKSVDANLVIVGKSGWLVEDVVKRLRNHPERLHRLIWLEGVSDEYLDAVYSASTCLLVASEGEGFGLPLIEAAQHRVPLLVRDLPVFREVAGPHASYFSGLSPVELASAIENWLNLYRAGHHPASHNLPWLTWHQSAEQLKKAIALA